ncbi:MAG: NYN domain-containing protein, partial [Luteitalea sp.]|nr:NYN domain-containing protein [Luteitalea sp.]
MKGFQLPNQDRLNIAVFIDFDNIEIGVRSTLGENFDIGAILDALKERGEVVTKIAYADWRARASTAAISRSTPS